MQRLIENFSIINKSIQELPLTEATIKGSSGKMLETKKKYRVPISRFDSLNLNERIYPKDLWERVIKEQKQVWEGSFSLADHPAEEGSFKDITGVWSNLHMDEKNNLVKADITFVGHYGKMAVEILEAGGKIGFSSSGFGDLKEDGKTVDPATYQIERIADCVLNPSQQVFGTLQDEIEENILTIEKPVMKAQKENVSMSTIKYTKLEERRFRESINQYLDEIASKSTTPDEKLKEYKEVLTYFDNKEPIDLYEKVKTYIFEAEKDVERAVKVVSKLKETFGVDDPEEFKEGIAKLATETSLQERRAEDWKKLTENLQNKIIELEAKMSSMFTVDQFKEEKNKFMESKHILIKKIQNLRKVIENKNSIIKGNELLLERTKEEFSALSKQKMEILNKYKALQEKAFVILSNSKSLEEENTKIRSYSKSLKEKYTGIPKIQLQKASNRMFEGFRQSNEVNAYYNDLVKQHGKDILPYKENILGSKTLFEAMRVYNNALVEMTNND